MVINKNAFKVVIEVMLIVLDGLKEAIFRRKGGKHDNR